MGYAVALSGLAHVAVLYSLVSTAGVSAPDWQVTRSMSAKIVLRNGGALSREPDSIVIPTAKAEPTASSSKKNDQLLRPPQSSSLTTSADAIADNFQGSGHSGLTESASKVFEPYYRPSEVSISAQPMVSIVPEFPEAIVLPKGSDSFLVEIWIANDGSVDHVYVTAQPRDAESRELPEEFQPHYAAAVLILEQLFATAKFAPALLGDKPVPSQKRIVVEVLTNERPGNAASSRDNAASK
jgi:hypothetical protein